MFKRCGSWDADDEAARAERKADEERERDQREKEEFEARLKARDDEKTRKLVESRIPKEDLEDAARRKYETEEEKEGLLPKLRDFSRQEYLRKREDAKLQEMEDAIRDEEMMFGCCPAQLDPFAVHATRMRQDDFEVSSAFDMLRPRPQLFGDISAQTDRR